MKKKSYTIDDLPEAMGMTASEYLEYEQMQSQAITDESEFYDAIRFQQTGKARLTSYLTKNKK